MTTPTPANGHTGGSWKWRNGFANLTGKYADCELVNERGTVIIPLRIDHRDPCWDIDPSDPDGVLPCKADRDLISAAPDLLAACEGLLRMFNELNPPGSGFSAYEKHAETARAAIAKAKGGVA